MKCFHVMKKKEQFWRPDWCERNVGLVVKGNSGKSSEILCLSHFLSRYLALSLSAPTSPCQTLLRENLWRLVLVQISANISGVRWAAQTLTMLLSCFTSSIKKNKKQKWWLNPVLYVTAKAWECIHGNHRNCSLYDVWHGVVTQNYLLLCWRTQWRDFSTNTN